MKNESTSPQIFRERERDGAVIHAGCSFCLLSMHGEGGGEGEVRGEERVVLMEGEVRVVVEGGGEGGRRGGGEGWEGVMVADTSVPPLPPPQRLSALHSTIKPTVT